MMSSDQDIFSNARIIDLRDSTVIDLNVESRVSIGRYAKRSVLFCSWKYYCVFVQKCIDV